MKCLICGADLENTYICPNCGRTDTVAMRIIYSSNWHYNEGLAKANIRDLSGAADSLRTSLQYNKRNTKARNLLGLIYFQMGEIVDALSEWVVSVHYQPKGNAATGYLSLVRDNPGLFQEANKVIKKYNTALDYIGEGSHDMAILELKKAVSLNPKYVKAYQLLALLYMQRGQYAAARKALTKAVKVDRNNMTTMNYLNEVNKHYKKPNRSKQSTAVRISDPTPIIIEKKEDKGYTEYNTGFISFINILIGTVIGAAVIWLLLVPSITKRKELQYNEAVVNYSAQLSERNKGITELKSQIEKLEKSVKEYESTVGSVVNDAGVSRQNLEKAMVNYLEDDVSTAGRAIADIDPDAISDDTEKEIYTGLREATKDSVVPTLYANAEIAFENADYTAAVDGFIKVLRMDSTYVPAIYHLARSYHRAGDLVNASAYYQQVVEKYSESDYVFDARKYLDQIEKNAGSDVTDAASRQNTQKEEEEQARAQAAETESYNEDYDGSSDGGEGDGENYEDPGYDYYDEDGNGYYY